MLPLKRAYAIIIIRIMCVWPPSGTTDAAISVALVSAWSRKSLTLIMKAGVSLPVDAEQSV